MGGGGAGMGGAIFNMGADSFTHPVMAQPPKGGAGSVVIINSTLTGNTAKGGPGFQGGGGLGGALFSLDGDVTLIYTTDDANTVVAGTSSGLGAPAVSADGGAAYNLAFGNDIENGGKKKTAPGAALTLVNSILADSFLNTLPTPAATDLFNNGPVAADQTLIIGATSLVHSFSLQNGPGAINPLVNPSPITIFIPEPGLSPLGSNGGLTQTQALPTSSPAYQQATVLATPFSFMTMAPFMYTNGPFDAVTTDQRGLPRNVMKPSMGAFEPQPTTVTVAATPETIAASTATSVTLSATVTSPGTTINEGQVTFTLKDSAGNVLGMPTPSGTVTGGAATGVVSLANALTPGTYTIDVTYSDSGAGGFVDNGLDTPAALTVAQTVATAASPTIPFSSSRSSVNLSATVTSNLGVVTIGTVTFTLVDSSGNTVGTAQTVNVSSGSASVVYPVTPLLNAGTYTIKVSYKDTTGTFGSAPGNPGTLTVTPATATVAAKGQSVLFSPNPTTITLSATVTSAAGTVNEGTVTFTLKDSTGTTIPGTPITSGTVSSGLATQAYVVPAGLATGTYTLSVAYADASPGNFTDDGTDTSASVAVTTATVNAVSNTITFNSAQTSVNLSATVNSNPGVVTQLTFSLLNSAGNLVGNATPTSGPVVIGTNTVSYPLPAALNAGTYTIQVTFTDSLGNTTAGTSGTLTVSPAGATVAANANPAINFNPSQTSVPLSATVTSNAGTVNEGAVTFTLKTSTGTVVGTPMQGQVSGGAAMVNYALSAPLGGGTYTVAVAYTDTAPGNFTDDGTDTPSTLTVNPAPVTTMAGATVPAQVFFSSNAQTINVTATVTSAVGIVNEGKVNFSILLNGVAIANASGNVVGGAVLTPIVLPANQAASSPTNVYTIEVSYSDPGGGFTDGGDTGASLTINPAPTVVAVGTFSVPFSTSAQSVAVNATVMANGSGPITGGTMNFVLTLNNGQTVTASPQVNSGSASATLQLPAGLAAGTYNLSATYAPVSTNFVGTANTGGQVIVTAATTSTSTSSSPASSSPVGFVGKAPSFTASQGFLGVNVQAFNSAGKQIGPTVFLSLFLFPFPVVSSVSFDASGTMDVHLSGLFFGLFPFAFDVFFSPSGGMTSFTLG
jgi:hypothetical protein